MPKSKPLMIVPSRETGYDSDHRLHITDTQARKLMEGLPLPDVGYLARVAEAPGGSIEGVIAHGLFVANFEGHFYLVCGTLPRQEWRGRFYFEPEE